MVLFGAAAAAFAVTLQCLERPVLALGACALGAALSWVGIRRHRAIYARWCELRASGAPIPPARYVDLDPKARRRREVAFCAGDSVALFAFGAWTQARPLLAVCMFGAAVALWSAGRELGRPPADRWGWIRRLAALRSRGRRE